MSYLRAVVYGVLAGAAATFAKSQAEGVLQPLSERLVPPTPVQKTGIGADSAGHPENMPPAELADRAFHAVTGDELTDEQRQKVSEPIHWSTGIGFGIFYAVVSRRVPAIRVGRGVVAGAGLFAATHGSSLPAAGVQHPVWKMPVAWWGWEAGSHLVYGAALDGSLTALERLQARVHDR